MDVKALNDYGNWVGHTPYEVYVSVMQAGGWQRVFPFALPTWASRIRQYFNLNPMSLTLLDDDESSDYLERAETAAGTIVADAVHSLPTWDPGYRLDDLQDKIGTLRALSGQVYKDRLGRIWFQMSPGAAIYHFQELPSDSKNDAIIATLRGQENIEVFKLICPDRTGGSRECVIIGNGRTTIGEVNEEVNLTGRFVKDSVRQGSYNYAETIEKGLAAHERLDVNTDPMQPGYFVEPSDLFSHSELIFRRFPEKDRAGKLLAEQTKPATTTWS